MVPTSDNSIVNNFSSTPTSVSIEALPSKVPSHPRSPPHHLEHSIAHSARVVKEGINLYVSHFPSHINSTKLKGLFEPFGRVHSAKVMHNPVTNESRCFGFVLFDHAEEGERAVEAMNGTLVEGHKLLVRAAHGTAMPQALLDEAVAGGAAVPFATKPLRRRESSVYSTPSQTPLAPPRRGREEDSSFNSNSGNVATSTPTQFISPKDFIVSMPNAASGSYSTGEVNTANAPSVFLSTQDNSVNIACAPYCSVEQQRMIPSTGIAHSQCVMVESPIMQSATSPQQPHYVIPQQGNFQQPYSTFQHQLHPQNMNGYQQTGGTFIPIPQQLQGGFQPQFTTAQHQFVPHTVQLSAVSSTPGVGIANSMGFPVVMQQQPTQSMQMPFVDVLRQQQQQQQTFVAQPHSVVYHSAQMQPPPLNGQIVYYRALPTQ